MNNADSVFVLKSFAIFHFLPISLSLFRFFLYAYLMQYTRKLFFGSGFCVKIIFGALARLSIFVLEEFHQHLCLPCVQLQTSLRHAFALCLRHRSLASLDCIKFLVSHHRVPDLSLSLSHPYCQHKNDNNHDNCRAKCLLAKRFVHCVYHSNAGNSSFCIKQF